MGTQLEDFFAPKSGKQSPNMAFAPSDTEVAIGTDKKKFSPLAGFVKARYKGGNHPRTLSRWLRYNKEPKWTSTLNDKWIAEIVGRATITTAHVIHSTCALALQAAADKTTKIIDVKLFMSTFARLGGNVKGATFGEVTKFLAGGFTKLGACDSKTATLTR